MLTLVLLCAGCEGVLGISDEDSATAGDGDGDLYEDGMIPDDAACKDVGTNVGANVLRRLSRVEYRLTLQDLFQLDAPPAADLVPNDVEQEGFTTFSDVQPITPQNLRAYLDTATAMFEALEADPARYDSVVGCDATEGDCLANFTSSFGRLAFRRPLTPDELDALTTAATENATDAADRIRYVTEALLVSPHFLFRVEVGDSMEGLSTLSPSELASKLSFTVWGRAPSASLLDRAEDGELSTSEGFVAVAEEMLSDPKAQAYYEDFFRQWLGYAQLRPPIEPSEDWSDDLMPEMMAETDALLEEYAWTPGEDFFDSLTANHTTVAPLLASFYGISPDANGRYEFSGTEPRASSGILGHASILSQKTDGDKVSVRGNWVRGTFLCQDLEIPQAIAETLGDELIGLTSIQIIEKRNTEAQCAGCHGAIDPIGVGLAQFDAAGRFDPNVDLSTYPVQAGFPDAEDPSFSSLGELASKLREMPELAACLTEQLFIYAHGRHAEGEDACAFEGATEHFTDDGNSFSSLLRGLVLSDGFRLRRAPTPTE